MGQFGFQKDHPKGYIGGGWKLREEMQRELRDCCSIQAKNLSVGMGMEERGWMRKDCWFDLWFVFLL